jgi:hypothetical protein
MKSLFYPNCAKIKPIGYEWGGYIDVKLFASNHNFELIKTWYVQNGFSPTMEQELMFSGYVYETENKPKYSVCLSANSTNEDTDEFYAFEELNAYIQSDYLEKFHKKNYSSIGVVFEHDLAYVAPKGRTRKRV